MKKSFLLGSFSGIIATLSQANPLFLQGIPSLAFVSLAPLFMAWMNAQSHRASQSAGLSFAFTATLGQSYWLAFFGDFSIFTLGGLILGYLSYFYIFSFYIWHLNKSSLPFKPLLLAMIWTFYEIAKSTGFLAHPWGLVAYPLHSWLVIIQIVDSIGVFGLGFFVALTNSLIAFWILGKERFFTWSLARFTALSFGIFFAYGFFTLATIPKPEDIIPVLMVQTNEDPWMGNEEKALQVSLSLSEKGLKEHPETELVIWSETILKRLYYNSFYLNTPWENPLHQILSKYPINWIIGAPAFKKSPIPAENLSELKSRIDNNFPVLGLNSLELESEALQVWWSNYPSPRTLYEPTNAILHISQKGDVKGVYSKRKLVAFAENIPFPKLPPFSWAYQGIGISSQWVKGEEVGIFDLVTRSGRLVKLGLMICFDDAFDLLGRESVQAGADLLVTLSNDAWSKTKSSEWQHHIVAKFRTVENRRVMLRSTNAGVSSVIDAWGRELAVLPLFKADSLAYEVPIYKKTTSSFTRGGDWFVSLLAFGFLGIVIVDYKKKKES